MMNAERRGEMDYAKLIYQRGSTRDYKPDPIEPEKMELLFEAVRLAPSAINRQPYKLYVISTKGREIELRKIYHSDWFVQPPYVICICLIDEQAWKRQTDGYSFVNVDAAIAFDQLIMMAANLGLGTCWLASFDPDAARNFLQLPDNQTPFLFTPLGYPATGIPPKHRKTVEQLVEWR
jgi:nitroreductase